ncbi:hypothetical protein MNBD_GAMMA21-329 [hydrothermal vent metagenome]|uniref:Uncharacterized protein n=1 Tax=hydrothermal vent metagenome TaxID=652676 RepID=A0A3B1AFC3_9ZZZZ
MAKSEEPKELLNALESIKGLLEQSENKLNAAKESIKLATPKPFTPLPVIEVNEIEDSDDEFDIPELDEIVVPAATAGAKPTVDMEVLKAFLDEMQKNIEKTMRDKLMKAVVVAENDVKKQMRAYLDQLRKMMDE